MNPIRTLFVLLFLFVLTGCHQDPIRLKGKNQMELPVQSEFVEPGMTLPKGYTYEVSGQIYPNILGTYTLEYTVFNPAGEMETTRSRNVNVIDKQAPQVTLKKDYKYRFGIDTSKNIVEELKDNYYSAYDLTITSNIEQINPKQRSGKHRITFTITDPSGNTTKASTIVWFQPINLLEICEYLYQNQDITGIRVSRWTRFDIHSYTFRFSDTETFHFYQDSKNNNEITFVYSKTIKQWYGDYVFRIEGAYSKMNKVTLSLEQPFDPIYSRDRTRVLNYNIFANPLKTDNKCYYYDYPSKGYAKGIAENIINDHVVDGVAALKTFFETTLKVIPY